MKHLSCSFKWKNQVWLLFTVSSPCLLYDSIQKKHFCPICQHEFAFYSFTPHLNSSTLHLNNAGAKIIILTEAIFLISAFILYYLVCLITGLQMKWVDLVVLTIWTSSVYCHNLFISRKGFDFLFRWMYCMHLWLLLVIHTVNMYITIHKTCAGFNQQNHHVFHKTIAN